MSFYGEVAPGYQALADALMRNLEPTPGKRSDDPGDLGAALTVVHQGRTVIDAWTGTVDHDGTPWQHDTLVNMYSVGKPVAAVLALDAVSRGELTLDTPLADSVWPELQEHSPRTTLRHMLTHQAGLSAVAEDLHDDDILDWGRMCGALAATPPWWEPGSAHGYHVNTYGFLVGEPVCRVSGLNFRDALSARMASPRRLDLHMGLLDQDLTRSSTVDLLSPDSTGAPHWPEDTQEQRMIKRSYFNPRTMSGTSIVNTSAWRQASVPSTNGQATARAIAGFYAALLPGAPDPLLPAELLNEATSEQGFGPDQVLGRDTRFGLGFQLHQEGRPIGTSERSYGHFGYGGSLGFADPDNDLAFAYLINRPGDRWQNPRTLRILDALRGLLSG